MFTRVNFQDLFDEQVADPEDFLKPYRKSRLLEAATFLINMDIQADFFSKAETTVNEFFSPTNLEIKAQLLSRLKVLQGDNDSSKFHIFNPQAGYMLFEKILSLTENEIEHKNSLDELELPLFKAYLTINSLIDSQEESGSETIGNLDGYEKLNAMYVTNSIGAYDISYFDYSDLATTQVVKSVLLFKFLESSDELNPLISQLKETFEVAKWEMYFESILKFVYPILMNPGIGNVDLKVDQNDKKTVRTIERFVLLEQTNRDEVSDFRKLRDTPLYRLDGNEGYRIISKLFAIEKIYKSQYFLLRKLNKELNISSLRSKLTLRFSEHVLLEKVISYAFDHKYFKLSGDYMSETLKIEGAPDYYIRNGKKVFFFESKDTLLDADVKTSFHYETIINGTKDNGLRAKLYKKLDADGSVKNRSAVIQLADQIEKVARGTIDFDELGNKTVAYPIIVVHDRVFSSPGINSLFKKWFHEEVSQRNINLKKVKVIDPVIIEIDTLILLTSCLRLYNIKMLETLIGDYNSITNPERLNSPSNQSYDHREKLKDELFMPFSVFVRNKLWNKHCFGGREMYANLIAGLNFK